MKISRSMTLRFLIIVIAAIVTTSGGLLWARPGAVACALLDQTSLTRWAGSKYSESSDSKKHERYDLLLEKARARIEEVYGESKSTPRVVFFDSKGPIRFYKPNPYGSTQFFGNKACVFIGPNGQNVDVVAHEFVRTDIHKILGTIDRTLYMSVWLVCLEK